MKTIEIVTPGHPHYNKVCLFANEVYEETIGAGTRSPPDTIIAAVEGDTVFGCIGLSKTVSSSLFLNDQRYWKALQEFPPGTKVGEQNIFAVRRFPAGIPYLITAVTACARHLGIHKIAFAGIAVSCRAVKQLGFEVKVLGKTEPSVFTEEERIKYTYWLEKHHPVSCILDTGRAEHIYQGVCLRFPHKAALTPELLAYATQ